MSAGLHKKTDAVLALVLIFLPDIEHERMICYNICIAEVETSKYAAVWMNAKDAAARRMVKHHLYFLSRHTVVMGE